MVPMTPPLLPGPLPRVHGSPVAQLCPGPRPTGPRWWVDGFHSHLSQSVCSLWPRRSQPKVIQIPKYFLSVKNIFSVNHVQDQACARDGLHHSFIDSHCHVQYLVSLIFFSNFLVAIVTILSNTLFIN